MATVSDSLLSKQIEHALHTAQLWELSVIHLQGGLLIRLATSPSLWFSSIISIGCPTVVQWLGPDGAIQTKLRDPEGLKTCHQIRQVSFFHHSLADADFHGYRPAVYSNHVACRWFLLSTRGLPNSWIPVQRVSRLRYPPSLVSSVSNIRYFLLSPGVRSPPIHSFGVIEYEIFSPYSNTYIHIYIHTYIHTSIYYQKKKNSIIELKETKKYYLKKTESKIP